MSFEAVINQALVKIFNKLGQDATYQPLSGDPVSCKVYLKMDVEPQPIGETEVWEKGTTIEYILFVIGQEANAGDTFTIESDTYTVKAVQHNNGYTVTVNVT